jgi:hypothetical protein
MQRSSFSGYCRYSGRPVLTLSPLARRKVERKSTYFSNWLREHLGGMQGKCLKFIISVSPLHHSSTTRTRLEHLYFGRIRENNVVIVRQILALSAPNRS